MPVEHDDIIDAVRRVWQLEVFIEKFTGVLMDNTVLPQEIKDEIQEIYQKHF